MMHAFCYVFQHMKIAKFLMSRKTNEMVWKLYSGQTRAQVDNKEKRKGNEP